jgi:hypothetical protein
MAVGLPMKALLLRDEPLVALYPVLTHGPYNLSIQRWTFETPTAKVAEACVHLLYFRLTSGNFALHWPWKGLLMYGSKLPAYIRPIKETKTGSP